MSTPGARCGQACCGGKRVLLPGRRSVKVCPILRQNVALASHDSWAAHRTRASCGSCRSMAFTRHLAIGTAKHRHEHADRPHAAWSRITLCFPLVTACRDCNSLRQECYVSALQLLAFLIRPALPRLRCDPAVELALACGCGLDCTTVFFVLACSTAGLSAAHTADAAALELSLSRSSNSWARASLSDFTLQQHSQSAISEHIPMRRCKHSHDRGSLFENEVSIGNEERMKLVRMSVCMVIPHQ